MSEIKAKVNGQTLWTGKVRVNWCHLFEPYKFEGEEKAMYRCDVLIRKDDKDTLAALEEAIKNAKEAYKGKDNKPFESFVKDGDERVKEDGTPDEPYQGCYYFSTKTDKLPNVRELKEGKVIRCEEEAVYSGCYGQIVIWLFAYNFSGKKGISNRLNGFLKTDDGEKLGGEGELSDTELWGQEVEEPAYSFL